MVRLWRECEAADPAWAADHAASVRAARAFVRSYRSADTLADMRATCEGFRKPETEGGKCCPWTGYCSDETAIDGILEALASDRVQDADDVEKRLDRHMDKAWEEECEAAMEDANVDESIRANEYEFTESGKIV